MAAAVALASAIDSSRSASALLANAEAAACSTRLMLLSSVSVLRRASKSSIFSLA